jgi:hypothetical protein
MPTNELPPKRADSTLDGTGTRGRILIVSKPAVRTGIYLAALALQGFFTRSFGNADAAARELDGLRFDCVLADGHDPTADVVVRQLRFRCGRTAAVMLLRSFAGGPLAPWTVDDEAVALPSALPQPWENAWEKRLTIFGF